jgi:uncharacterized RDD family membrane protein YckC
VALPSPGKPAQDAPAARLADAPSADPWRRFMCVAYEGVILFGVVFFFAYGFSALTQYKSQPGAMRYAFQGFMFVVLGLYFVWFWSHGRRTLPMKTMGVTLVDREGRPASTRRSILRYVAASAGWAIPLAIASHVHGAAVLLIAVPFAWTLFDRRRRALYDIASGTRLVAERR